jgi:hypothetical protein
MATYFESGAAVESGYYLNPATWAIEPVPGAGGRLPAGLPGQERWLKVPMLVALGLTPVLGLTFLMFLPLAGFVLFFLHLVGLVTRPFRKTPPTAPTPPGG